VLSKIDFHVGALVFGFSKCHRLLLLHKQTIGLPGSPTAADHAVAIRADKPKPELRK